MLILELSYLSILHKLPLPSTPAYWRRGAPSLCDLVFVSKAKNELWGNLLPAEGEAGYERALEKVKAVRELREGS